MRLHAGAAALRNSLIVIALGLVAVSGLPTAAVAYTGVLSSPDQGVLGTGQWIKTGPTAIEWDAAANGDGSWHYSYTLTHPAGATSHIIIEVSENFTEADIWAVSGDVSEIEIGWHYSGSGNPTMPSDVFGIKFGADGLSTHVEFDCNRLPEWGDFYAKDGQAGGAGLNSAWNAGFTGNDVDPEQPPQDGSIDYHILVPNTHYSPVHTATWGAIKAMYR